MSLMKTLECIETKTSCAEFSGNHNEHSEHDEPEMKQMAQAIDEMMPVRM